MAKEKFKHKEGDIVKPLPNRKTSNSYSIDKIVSAQVMRINNKYAMTIKILEGSVTYMYGGSRYNKGNELTIYQDAFEPTVKSDEDYDIF